MTVKERILMIRLLEKLEDHPAYAEALGVEATGAVKQQYHISPIKGLAVK